MLISLSRIFLMNLLCIRILEDVGDRLSNEINEKFLRDLAPNFVSRQLPTYNDSYEWLVEQAKIIHATNPVDISFTTDGKQITFFYKSIDKN